MILEFISNKQETLENNYFEFNQMVNDFLNNEELKFIDIEALPTEEGNEKLPF